MTNKFLLAQMDVLAPVTLHMELSLSKQLVDLNKQKMNKLHQVDSFPYTVNILIRSSNMIKKRKEKKTDKDQSFRKFQYQVTYLYHLHLMSRKSSDNLNFQQIEDNLNFLGK
jgi:hypothetical protein